MAREVLRAAHIVVRQQYVIQCERCEADLVVAGNLLDELTTRLMRFQQDHKRCAATEIEPEERDDGLRSQG